MHSTGFRAKTNPASDAGADNRIQPYNTSWVTFCVDDDVSVRDTRSKSLSEALINTFGGYPIGYLLGIAILPSAAGWIQEDPFGANIFITLAFSAATFVRIYFLRRLFARFGYDDNVIRLILRLRRRLRSR